MLNIRNSNVTVFKWSNSNLFLFIFVLFNNNFSDFSRIQTLIVGPDGEHTDHLTTPTAL